jgi:hypothetical protein
MTRTRRACRTRVTPLILRRNKLLLPGESGVFRAAPSNQSRIKVTQRVTLILKRSLRRPDDELSRSRTANADDASVRAIEIRRRYHTVRYIAQDENINAARRDVILTLGQHRIDHVAPRADDLRLRRYAARWYEEGFQQLGKPPAHECYMPGCFTESIASDEVQL